MTTPQKRFAIREKHLDACRSQAIRMMETPLGLAAIEGGHYIEMFQWLYHELVAGRTPTGVPAKLMEQWKRIGEFRMERGRR